jgi:K+-sensing histidine kinase KdpD
VALDAASGAAAYSYFFLPPEGFGIEDPEDWIAFVVFTVTAVIAGELASRAERRAAEAKAGQQEIQRLYQELQAAFERASEAERDPKLYGMGATLAFVFLRVVRRPSLFPVRDPRLIESLNLVN